MVSKAKNRTTDTSSCHCTTLRKASRHISQLYNDALAESGLKATQRSILNQIGRSQPTTIRALADNMVMDAGALAHTLKPLERDGLIAIGIDPSDRRNRQITLTDLGRNKLTESEAGWKAAQRGFEAAVGKMETGALREALQYLMSESFTADFAQSRASE